MKRRRKIQLVWFTAAVLCALLLARARADCAKRISLRSTDYVEEGEEPLTRARVAFYRDFLVRNPDIQLIPFRSLDLPPAIFPSWRSRLLFAMLGDAGPDHIVSSIEDWQVLFDQNFLYPLDEYIFDVLRDTSGRPVDPDGRPIDPKKDELFYRDGLTGKYSAGVPIPRRVSVCSEWDNLPPMLRPISIRGGSVYGIPVLEGFTCLIYRSDLFVGAGLDPGSPPADWNAFIYCAQKLTEPDKPIRGAPVQKGQYAFACGTDAPSEWLNYLWQAGGDALHKIEFCPHGHRVDAKKEAEFPPKCPLCGKKLLHIRQSWAPVFDSDAGVVALNYYRALRSVRWTRCPRCGEPVNVPAETEKPPGLTCNGPKGCRHTFPYPPADRIYRGVVRPLETGEAGEHSNLLAELFERGEVAMVMVDHPYRFIADLRLPAESIGMMLLPAGGQWVQCPRCAAPIILTDEMKASRRAVCPRDSPSVNLSAAEVHGGLRANSISVTMWAVSSSSSRTTRHAVWRLMRQRMNDQGKIAMAQSLVGEGCARAVRPSHLLLAGYEQLYRALPKSWILVEAQGLSSGRITPCTPDWSTFMRTGLEEMLRRARLEQKVDLRATLKEAAARCAATIGTEDPAAARERKKGVLGIILPVAVLLLLAVGWLYQALPRRKSGPRAPPATVRKRQALAWLLTTPALLLLIAWVLIPLLRATQMAFYDWQAVGQKRFLGILNFADIVSSPEFWRILFQTVLFVGISLTLGLAAPILLALLLAEVPRGKYLFRTIFYLPALISGLAVALLWKLMYDPGETGFLNWLLMHMPRSTYLIFPFLLMVAFAGLSAFFLRRREFIPGAVLLILCIALVLIIPRIQPLRHPISWLANPAAGGIWTMICVIVPAVWASAGPGSIIYIAALRAIPQELYESAELDGAGVFAKIRHITFTELKPLITINLIGAIVGTSQAIRNIFVMTGGEPHGKTKVLALDFWYRGFVYLRFGYATALAWILASMLIGFTVCQVRRLLRADLRPALGGMET